MSAQLKVAFSTRNLDLGSKLGRDDDRERPVQRSVSLQPQRRPIIIDRNNNGANNLFGDCGNFQLANLLARAASFDAKLFRDLQDSEKDLRITGTDGEVAEWCAQTIRTSPDSPDGRGRTQSDSERIEFPQRYRGTRSVCPPSGPRLSGGGVRRSSAAATTLEPLPECELEMLEPHSLITTSRTEQWLGSSQERERDFTQALMWLRQEIRTLKQTDRALMRDLFRVGTEIHRLSGGLNETISCRTITASDSQLNLNERLDTTNDSIHLDTQLSPTATAMHDRDVQPIIVRDEGHVDSDGRAVSMISLSGTDSPAPPKRNSLRQRVSRLMGFLSLEHITESRKSRTNLDEK